MTTRNKFLYKKISSFLWFFAFMVCVGGDLPQYNCPEGCVGLEPSSENITESSDYETSIDDSLVEEFNISSSEFLRFATPCETPNHESSLCMAIADCPVLLAVAEKKKYADFVEASRCGPSNENKIKFKVCCGKYNSFRNVSKHIETTTADPTPSKDNSVFPKTCGTQKFMMRGRIVGGIEAALGEYPWLARIIHKNNYGYKTYGCAGFLIHTKYVVTAAHCINSEFSRIRGDPYSVVLGEHNIETKLDCSRGGTFCADPPQVSRISTVVVHQDYSNKSKNHHNDIALIYLRKAARFSDYVRPICLLTNASEKVEKYFISGWGKTETKESSPVKLKVDLEPFDKEECQSKFQMLNLEIDDTQICAGGVKLKDSCNGDSGGPLMMSPNITTTYAAGLVSYGIGCGMESWPGVYTSIPAYVNWIETQILKLSLAERMANPKKTRKNKKKQKATEGAAVENGQSNT